MRTFLLWAMLIAGFCLGLRPAFAGSRIALVIGNGGYANTPALANPGNDAEDVAKALSAAGFKVALKRDASKRDFDLSLAQFTRDARDAEVALFYFAGHGMQYGGANYVMPVDAALQDDVSLRYEMVSVSDVQQALENSPGVKILVLDSCRDNPLADRLRRSLSGGARGGGAIQGLAPAQPSPGMIVVYATQSGHVAMDGEGARNSPFAKAFVEELGVPGLEVAALFRAVEQKVLTSTNGAQSPELSISGVPEYYLVAASPDRKAWDEAAADGGAEALIGFLSRFPGSAYAREARERLKAAQGAEAADATEALFWESTEKSGTISDYANYLKKYPTGAFASIAVNRIASLAARPAAPLPGATPSSSPTAPTPAAPVRLTEPYQTAKPPSGVPASTTAVPTSRPARPPRRVVAVEPAKGNDRPPKPSRAKAAPTRMLYETNWTMPCSGLDCGSHEPRCPKGYVATPARIIPNYQGVIERIANGTP